MGKIVMDMSMSLDGFITATNDSPDQPLGAGCSHDFWGVGLMF
jgi:hypothetical protein